MEKGKYRILFVCTGNLCRSPMAAGILKRKLPQRFDGKVIIQSAGTMRLEDNEATPLSISVARDKGVDLSHHRSRGLKQKMVEEADIIFAMAKDHREYLEREYPRLRENIFLLKTFGRNSRQVESQSVEDPMGGSREVYERCFDQIEEEIDRILPRLVKLIEDKLEAEEEKKDPYD
jgi:protein-tyrosine-phosphatase